MPNNAQVVELVYTHDSKSCGFGYVGSNPTLSTTTDDEDEEVYFFNKTETV